MQFKECGKSTRVTNPDQIKVLFNSFFWINVAVGGAALGMVAEHFQNGNNLAFSLQLWF